MVFLNGTPFLLPVQPSPAGTGGRIIFVSATLHYRGSPFQTHVAVAKAGVDALSNNVAIEFGPLGVTSNVIAPGPIAQTEVSLSIPLSPSSLSMLFQMVNCVGSVLIHTTKGSRTSPPAGCQRNVHQIATTWSAGICQRHRRCDGISLVEHWKLCKWTIISWYVQGGSYCLCSLQPTDD